MPDPNQILLHTKLHRPRLPHDLVVRPRLVEWLNHDPDHPLTLVCAPAGFGKTTLVCSWLESLDASQGGVTPLPSAWLSLDENDSDLNLFLRYFIAVIRTIFSEACQDTLAFLWRGSTLLKTSCLPRSAMSSNSFPGRFSYSWTSKISTTEALNRRNML